MEKIKLLWTNALNVLTDFLAFWVSVLELLLFWLPKINIKLKELEETLKKIGTTMDDLKELTKKGFK